MIALRARCNCLKHEFTTHIPSSSLPLQASLCHCTSCRHNTGSLYFSCTPWPDDSLDLSPLKRYSFSSNTDIFSCDLCSTQLFCRGTKPGERPEVLTSALDDTPGLVRYSHHIFVGDTIDGGASILLRYWADGTPLRRWRGHKDESEELPVEWPGDSGTGEAERNGSVPDAQSPTPDFTPLTCHCNGVRLFLRAKPTIGSTSLDTRDSWAGEATRDEPTWSLHPVSGKPKAIMQALFHSRQRMSSDIQYWAYLPIKRIVPEAHPSVPSMFDTDKDLKMALARNDPRLGTLMRDARRPDDIQSIETYSCKVCSATVFQVYGSESDLVFVAVGVIDHPDGARADGLLHWGFDGVRNTDEADRWRGELFEAVNKACRERKNQMSNNKGE